MIKRVFGDSVRSKTPVAQENEVLLKIIAHNTRYLVPEMHGLGIMPNFPQLHGPHEAQAVAQATEQALGFPCSVEGGRCRAPEVRRAPPVPLARELRQKLGGPPPAFGDVE